MSSASDTKCVDPSGPLSLGPRSGRSAYQSFFTFTNSSDCHKLILDQFATWLRDRKAIDVDLDENLRFQHDNRTLTAIHNTKRDGTWTRCRLVEAGDNTWRTDLTFFTPARSGRGWADVAVGSDLDYPAKPPNFFDRIVDIVDDPRDGLLPLHSTPPLITSPRTEEIIAWIADPERHALLFIAGTNDQLNLQAWREKVRLWSRDVRGLAQAVVLDPASTEIANSRLGYSHQIRPWTIRTFQPDVDLEESADGSRHRILGWQRLGQDSDSAIRSLLAGVARRHASRRPRPLEVVRATRDLDRVTSALLLDQIFGNQQLDSGESRATPIVDTSANAPSARSSLVEPPAIAPTDSRINELESLRKLAHDQRVTLSQVAAVLGDDWSIDDLRHLAGQSEDLRQARAESARNLTIMELSRTELKRTLDQADDLREQIELLQLELRDEEQEREIADLLRMNAEEESFWLRRQLQGVQEWTLASAKLPSEEEPVIPDSFDEVVDRISEFESSAIVFTGDKSTTRRLSDLDGSGKLARAAWECLLVLKSYIAARQCGDHDGNVHHYLEATPPGYRGYLPKKHASTESGATIAQFGHLRSFSVPIECTAEGAVTMLAHFKLGKVGMQSPRLHYFNDYSNTGRIYIGYIGPHLRTVTTN